MSWLFSRALVEASLGANSLDGEPSAPSNGSHIPQAYCAPDKTTAFSRLSRFGMTFKPLTEDRGEALLMSYRAAFPVKTSPLPTSTGTDSTGSGQGCGERWRGWLAKYDHASSSWRTAQCSLLSEEPESLEILPRSGMTRDGLLWEQPMSVRPTNGTGSGLWRTPDTGAGGTSGLLKQGKTHRSNGQPIQIRLVDQVLNPRLWPTPAARDYKGANGFETTQRKIGEGKRAQMGQLPNAVQQELGRPIGGTLNPNWTEWLMGWPPGWTDLKPLATDKYPSVPQQHGENSIADHGTEP
jgi:hypothetical protein